MADALTFRPVLDTEPSAAVAGNDLRVETSGQLIAPVPADAPLPDVKLVGRKPDEVLWFRNESGASLFVECRWNLEGGAKEVRPACYSDQGWKLAAHPAPRPIYNLDKLAARPNESVWLFEGPRKAEMAQACFPGAVTSAIAGGANAITQSDLSPLRGRSVTLGRDSDEAGANWQRHVIVALRAAGAAFIRFVNVKTLPGELIERIPKAKRSKFDIVDLVEAGIAPAEIGGAFEAACVVVDMAETPMGASDEVALERRIVELSALTEVKYLLARSSSAKELGVPVTVLDKLVKAKRSQVEQGQGRAITLPVIEPWPHAVNAANVLGELVQALRSYVILSPTQADAVALWITFTYVHDAFDVSPRLVVKSAQKRSGKTTLFIVLFHLVSRPRGASAITSSALLRIIELHSPTMLIDEMDALMGRDKEMAEALRGLINSGFNRDFATFTMNVPTGGGGYEPREFSTWCPLAVAGIGEVPETVRDRSIEIEMKRKLTTETVKRLRRRDGADLNEIARKLARWTEDNVNALHAAEPTMPHNLNDRAADAWEPLVAIADLTGGEWPSRAKAAALALSGDDLAAAKDDNIDTMLLSDIRDAFESKSIDRLSSEDLTKHLTGLEARPWGEWSHGKPMSKYQLSKRLKRYGVVSGTIKLGEAAATAKGYHFRAFEDAFCRYLPSPTDSTRHHVTFLEKQGEIQSVELVTKPNCDEWKNAEIPSNSWVRDEVTSSMRLSERESVFDGKCDASAVRRSQDPSSQEGLPGQETIEIAAARRTLRGTI